MWRALAGRREARVSEHQCLAPRDAVGMAPKHAVSRFGWQLRVVATNRLLQTVGAPPQTVESDDGCGRLSSRGRAALALGRDEGALTQVGGSRILERVRLGGVDLLVAAVAPRGGEARIPS